jgi:uncharacterized protein YkwD
MQLNSNSLSLALVTVFTLSLLPAQLQAQQTSELTAAALLPEAPQPQSAPVESPAQQTASQQSQNSQPASSIVSQYEAGSISGTVTAKLQRITARSCQTIPVHSRSTAFVGMRRTGLLSAAKDL